MKSFLAAIILVVMSMTSCDLNTDSNGSSNSSVEIIPKNTNHLFKKTYYPSGQIETAIAYNTYNLKDSISNYYDKSGNLDSTVDYFNGKLNGKTTIYYSDRTDIKLYKNGKLITYSIYDSSNVLEYRTPLDGATIPNARFRLLSGRKYLDKNKKDTMILVTGIPPANQILSIQGAVIQKVNDTTFKIWSTNNKHSDSVLINISIQQNTDFTTPTTENSIFEFLRIAKK